MAVELVQAGADRISDVVHKGEPSKVVSSLAFHHFSLATKRAAFEAIFGVLRSGGRLHVADYGLQRTWLNLDGFETTQPNADGILPKLMAEAGFDPIIETSVISTPTGSISFYEAHRP